jgi:hypothetical protein
VAARGDTNRRRSHAHASTTRCSAPAEEVVSKTIAEKGHGRIETRTYTASSKVDWTVSANAAVMVMMTFWGNQGPSSIPEASARCVQPTRWSTTTRREMQIRLELFQSVSK